jgi:hypothetical protein
VTALAHTSPTSELDAQFRAAVSPEGEATAPHFAMENLNVRATSDDLAGARSDLYAGNTEVTRVTISGAANDKAAWLAADLRYFGDCGGDSRGCGQTLATGHVSALYERAEHGWRPVVWNVAVNDTVERQARLIKDGKQLAAIPAQIDGADDAVKLFKASIGDAKTLAASVSDRKDVLLYGSDNGERYVGAQVKAKLAAWKLGFDIHDGIRAGVTADGSVAWVAANVDVKPPGKPTPFRALFFYERKAGRWSLVQAQFSFGGW